MLKRIQAGVRSNKVRVAVIGVGNCASSLVQGVKFYGRVQSNELPAGLMHPDLGGYKISDIEFSAAFDVNATKVGRDLAEAIVAEPNDTKIFSTVPRSGITVSRGPTLDGIGCYVSDAIHESSEPVADVAAVLRRTGTHVVANYLPVGSQQATEFYAEKALEAGCAFVNCMPVFIASSAPWRKRFESAGLPIIGDDIKSQVGATIVHRRLLNLFRQRGVRVERTSQLNVGGNMDFRNMLERERLQSKKISKTQAVLSELDGMMDVRNVHVGPSDHVAWLGDRKWAHIRIEGIGFGNLPVICELKLEVWDSPNSAGVVIDAVRCAKLGLDRGAGGALIAPSSYYMKSPPVQFDDDKARRQLEKFIRGHSRKNGAYAV
jgi:myo-inositol-1-phosphate synthase